VEFSLYKRPRCSLAVGLQAFAEGFIQTGKGSNAKPHLNSWTPRTAQRAPDKDRKRSLPSPQEVAVRIEESLADARDCIRRAEAAIARSRTLLQETKALIRKQRALQGTKS
jgi:hypothetical protein